MKIDEPFSAYLGNDAIGTSELKVFLECPAKFRKTEHVSTPALEFGSALHDVILCGGKNTHYAAHLDLRRNADKAEYAELLKLYENVVRSQEDIDAIEGMKASIHAHSPEFVSYIDRSIEECSFYATCPVSGLKLKSRPDVFHLEKKAKLDLKTTVDAVKFINQVYKYKYYIQDAFHSYVCELAGYPAEISGWFAIEKTKPYVHRLVLIDKNTQLEMREHVINSLVQLRDSLNGMPGAASMSPRLERQDFVFVGDKY